MRTITIFLCVCAICIAGFLALTYDRPFEMVFDTSCSESPIGFYRMQIVSYELTAYEGAEVQAYAPKGGLLEFAQFYLGTFDPCAR